MHASPPGPGRMPPGATRRRAAVAGAMVLAGAIVLTGAAARAADPAAAPLQAWRASVQQRSAQALTAASISGQITMRKVDGWQTLAEQPDLQCIDLAA